MLIYDKIILWNMQKVNIFGMKSKEGMKSEEGTPRKWGPN